MIKNKNCLTTNSKVQIQRMISLCMVIEIAANPIELKIKDTQIQKKKKKK